MSLFLKEAGFWGNKDFWGDVGTKALTSLLAVGAITTIAAGAEAIIEALKERRTVSKSKDYYIKMLENSPHLKDVDPKKLALHWESLNHFAPFVAQDPLAAGAYLTQTLERDQFGGPSIDTYNTLTSMEKARADAKDKNKSKLIGELRNSINDSIISNSIKDIYTSPIDNSEEMELKRYAYNLNKKKNSREKDIASLMQQKTKLEIKRLKNNP